MSDIIVETSTPRSSSDDPDRRELMWKAPAEALVTRTRDEANAAAIKHERAAKKSRLLYQCFGLPTVLVPLAGSVAAQFVPEAAVTVAMVCAAMCGAANTYLNFGAKASHHNEFHARWLELSSVIDFEVCRPRADRAACDLFLEKIQGRATALRAAEPVA